MGEQSVAWKRIAWLAFAREIESGCWKPGREIFWLGLAMDPRGREDFDWLEL